MKTPLESIKTLIIKNPKGDITDRVNIESIKLSNKYILIITEKLEK